MSRLAIVTDSTASIPENILREYPIFVLPLQVIWGERTYLDGVDLTATQFYTRLAADKQQPSTSQASPAEFVQLYQDILNKGYDQILSIHLSSKLSGTYTSAVQAIQEMPKGSIEVMDSTFVSMAMGFQVLTAARAAVNGAAMKNCKNLVTKSVENVGVFFVVETLEYLRRGGRIGGAAAFLGTALNLKPILNMTDGVITPVERVRTMKKAIDRLLEHSTRRINGANPIRISVLHAQAPQEAEILLAQALQHFNSTFVSEAFVSEVSPVLGTHTGPGTLGLAFMAGM